ncbi:MAG: YihY/virulence factor BrkB family protein [Clostridiaceae bacterium]|nr:YihY/virulence factor BrkB family protein [Clostridiaceae bacterium]
MIDRLRSCILFKYIKQLILRYKEDDVPSMSAQISYYLILSFFPFLLFLINLLSFTHLSSEILIANFSTFLPMETGTLVKNIVAQTLQAKSTVLLFLGMLGSLWSASRGIYAIIKGLNKAYDIDENRSFVKLNSIALISTFGVIIIIILAFTMIVFGKVIGTYVFGLIGAQAVFNIIWSFLRYSIPLTLMLLTFSLLYKYVPNRHLKFSDIIVGTIFATIGWIAISLLFSFYVNNFSNYEKVYGSLGGVIALILWIYISTLIILIGGELNAIKMSFIE